MKILVLISLLVPAIVAIIQYFLSKEKRKVQIILATLTLIGVGLAYFLTMNDAAENEKLKQASARSESLLKNANDQLSKQ
jgi:cell division protein FtsN